MDAGAPRFLFGQIFVARHAEEVHADTRGESGQRRISAGVGGSDQPQDEAQAQGDSQAALQGNCWEEQVGPFDGEALGVGVQVQQHTEGEEEQVDGHQHDGKRPHVELGFSQRATTQVLLHHVLVEPGHGDGDKRPRDKHFYTVSGVTEIVEKPPPAHVAIRH